MVNWAKNARINSSGYSPPHWVIGRGYTLPGSLLDEKQSGELASLVLPEHSPEFGRRMSWLWAARRACETMNTCHRLRRALSAGCSSKCSHTGDCERRAGLFGGRSRKTEPTRGRHLLRIGGMVQPLWSANRRTMCSCLIAVA